MKQIIIYEEAFSRIKSEESVLCIDSSLFFYLWNFLFALFQSDALIHCS